MTDDEVMDLVGFAYEYGFKTAAEVLQRSQPDGKDVSGRLVEMIKEKRAAEAQQGGQ